MALSNIKRILLAEYFLQNSLRVPTQYPLPRALKCDCVQTFFLNLFLFLFFSVFPQLSINKMDPMSQVFCLRWNNHRNNLLTVLDQLLQTEAFCDVTLACENASIKCHKMILSACSTYFQSLFMENTCEHPIVFLKDIKIQEIKVILDYMYKGEVNVAQEELPGTIK